MSDEAWKCFVQGVCQFTSDLAKETARLEQAERDLEGDVPEVTSTMVRKALKKQREPLEEPVKKPISKQVYAISMAAICLTAGSGILGSYLHSTWQWVTFTIVCCAALASNAIAILGRTN